jgi:hypothetical protein
MSDIVTLHTQIDICGSPATHPAENGMIFRVMARNASVVEK